MNQPEEIQAFLSKVLKSHIPPLSIKKESQDLLEVTGTKPTMQGKQQVEGHYFASLILKPKDVRFYFFPVYTHAYDFESLSPELRKCLKGKSCFHFKKLSSEIQEEISSMISQGIAIYQVGGLI